jgi:hypothetical protein
MLLTLSDNTGVLLESQNTGAGYFIRNMEVATREQKSRLVQVSSVREVLVVGTVHQRNRKTIN